MSSENLKFQLLDVIEVIFNAGGQAVFLSIRLTPKRYSSSAVALGAHAAMSIWIDLIPELWCTSGGREKPRKDSTRQLRLEANSDFAMCSGVECHIRFFSSVHHLLDTCRASTTSALATANVLLPARHENQSTAASNKGCHSLAGCGPGAW
jgi:hypothetical protein